MMVTMTKANANAEARRHLELFMAWSWQAIYKNSLGIESAKVI
jgi:hypothetical protein